ncbi:MAG: Gfo/Idh/MocA family oxidoreductase [Acidobacteriales bacterium]|nr:Gfo/Idh/MocA family oxidoreductase [Terriglobales bacterium]
MNDNRRAFFKRTSLAGLGLAGAPLLDGVASALDTRRTRKQQFNMSGYAAPRIEKVRVGIIGLGNRGPSHLETMRYVEGVEFRALCDVRPERVAAARKRLDGTNHNPTLYSGNKDEWMKLCEQDDVDLVIIATPYYMHAGMAVYAMEHGKHAASEVPVAATLEECWKVVETAERTRKHCMMLENYAYGFFQVLTLNMARQGFFGDIVHGECAYNTSKMKNNFSKTTYWDMWWLKLYASKRGNIYPTHGLGPISQIMNINRGDRFDYLVSMESNDFMMQAKARELAATDDFFKPFADKTYRGNINTSIIRTVKGRTIMLQHDATSPRGPHTVIHGITGTKGMALEYPLPPRISKDLTGWVSQQEYETLAKEYTPAIITRMRELSKRVGTGHGGTDLLEDWRLIDCLRNGLPLDQDVYDGVIWSSIIPLSAWSVMNRSNSIDVPDFTAGAWEKNLPNMDINLTRGGTTKVLV